MTTLLRSVIGEMTKENTRGLLGAIMGFKKSGVATNWSAAAGLCLVILCGHSLKSHLSVHPLQSRLRVCKHCRDEALFGTPKGDEEKAPKMRCCALCRKKIVRFSSSPPTMIEPPTSNWLDLAWEETNIDAHGESIVFHNGEDKFSGNSKRIEEDEEIGDWFRLGA